MNEEQKLKARERQRLYRQKLKEDPLKHSKYKAAERKRWAQRVKDGSVKCVSQMKNKEKEKIRAIRRTSAAKHRAKVKAIEESLVTPALSKQTLGRKKKNLNRSSVVRHNKKLEAEVQKLRSQVWRYKKRVKRAVKIKNTPSPRTKVNSELKGQFVPTGVKRKLLFSEALQADLQITNSIKSTKVKHVLSKAFRPTFLKKYKMMSMCNSFMSGKIRRKHSTKEEMKPENILKYDRVTSSSHSAIVRRVTTFFNRDDVSAMCPGKGRRNYAKLGGVLKRKRIMRGTISELYQKFCKECVPGEKIIVYSLFCRLKPFYVIDRDVNQRLTCLCNQCQNYDLLCSALHAASVLPFPKSSALVKSLCCDRMTKLCAERQCNTCKVKEVEFLSANNNKLVNRQKWVTIKENKEGLEKPIKRTVKKESRETVAALRTELHNTLPKFLGHFFRFNHQNATIKKIKESVKPGELILQIDFSENYDCKYGEEIQSVYYGGSREHVSLHQGVGRAKNIVKSFCTLSKCTRKDSAAIGAHLVPILDYFVARQPGLTKLILVSDSPSNQYRNKETFYMVVSILTSLYPQLTEVEVHFTESGHGKNECDGVGGWLKTAADDTVRTGGDIATFEDLVRCVKKKAVKTYIDTITQEDVLDMAAKIPPRLEPFNGTMKVHYYSWSKENRNAVHMSSVSCLDCKPGTPCSHFGLPGSPWIIKNPFQLDTENPAEDPDVPPAIQDEGVAEIALKSWVAVLFNGIWYPGIVDHITKQYVWVNFMVRHASSDLLFTWPTPEDKHRLLKKKVFYVLKLPPVAESREFYSIPELEKINDLAASAVLLT